MPFKPKYMSFLSLRSYRLSNLIGPLLFLCICSASQAQSLLLDEDKFEELIDAHHQDSLRNLLEAQEQNFKNLSQAEIALTYYL